MANIKTAGKEAVMCGDVSRHIAEEVPWSNQFMKPIAVFVRDQFNHYVQGRLVEERSHHSPERLTCGKVEHFQSQNGP